MLDDDEGEKSKSMREKSTLTSFAAIRVERFYTQNVGLSEDLPNLVNRPHLTGATIYTLLHS